MQAELIIMTWSRWQKSAEAGWGEIGRMDGRTKGKSKEEERKEGRKKEGDVGMEEERVYGIAYIVAPPLVHGWLEQ